VVISAEIRKIIEEPMPSISNLLNIKFPVYHIFLMHKAFKICKFCVKD